jgi:hypothetical protein
MSPDGNSTGEDPRARLHPAEHRAYRELYVACRQLINRWGRLAAALDGMPEAPVIRRAAAEVERLLAALGSRIVDYGLHAGPAANGLGARIADLRGAITDRTVDTGMVMRLAVLDIEHVRTLLRHLAALARARGDLGLAAFCDEWADNVKPEVRQVRQAAIRLGASPDRAAAPIDDSLIGRTAHRAGWAFGAVGEALDRATALAPGGGRDKRDD